MKYHGFYINLDRSSERKARIERELAQNGLQGYVRFAASEGNVLGFPNPASLTTGEMGCFTSHYRLLTQNRNSTQPLHVIEDDILLSSQSGQVLDWFIDNGQLDKFDLLFTDVAVPLLNDACHAYKAFYDAAVVRDAQGKIEKVIFSAIDMRELIFASTCSFLVNPKSIGKLADLFEKELKSGARMPVDLYIRKLCQEGIIGVGCIFPFVTSIKPESGYQSTLEAPRDYLAAYAANMLRHSFFVGCDMEQCLTQAGRDFPQPASNDAHRQMMLRLLGFSLSPDYKKC